jgi:hypothetical protein
MNTVSLNADTRQLAQAVRELVAGGTNAAGSFTLAVGATSTPVKDTLATPGCWVLITPTSAGAAASGAFISAKGSGSFTVTHASAAAGSTFDYVIFHG